MFDFILAGGRVVDGTGSPWFRADVGVRGDRIAAVGALGQAETRHRLDVAGQVVAPGFVDTHVHADLALLADPLHEAAIRQGVTTYLLGQDGVAMAPASPPTLAYMRRYTAGFSGRFEMAPGKIEARPVKVGDVFVLPRNLKHAFEKTGSDDLVLLVVATVGWKPLEDTTFHE